MKTESLPFFEVEMRACTGGRHIYAFVTEEAARRCLAHYAERARREAAAIAAVPGLVAPRCEFEADAVTFRWASPVGPLRWCAYLRRLASEDHLWPVRPA